MSESNLYSLDSVLNVIYPTILDIRGLKADALIADAQPKKCRYDRRAIGRHFHLAVNASRKIDNADARLADRNVESDKLIHVRSSVLTRAEFSVSEPLNTITYNM